MGGGDLMKIPAFKETRNTKYIISVDDQSSVRRLLGMVLERVGFRVDLFESGADLLRFLEINRGKLSPHVIILDVEMPVMNGYEICHTIKRDFPEISSPIIFFSALDSVSSFKKALQVGGDDYFVKPFEPDKLVAAIDDWCGKKTGWDSSQITLDHRRDKRLVVTAYEDRSVREMVSLALEKAGYSVEAYENGIATLIALERSIPSVILLDAHLSDIDGFDVCEKI